MNMGVSGGGFQELNTDERYQQSLVLSDRKRHLFRTNVVGKSWLYHEANVRAQDPADFVMLWHSCQVL